MHNYLHAPPSLYGFGAFFNAPLGQAGRPPMSWRVHVSCQRQSDMAAQRPSRVQAPVLWVNRALVGLIAHGRTIRRTGLGHVELCAVEQQVLGVGLQCRGKVAGFQTL